MIRTLGLLALLSCLAIATLKTTKQSNVRTFPNGFIFGASTAAYQIEGAWNEDGRSESIWDTVSHLQPCRVQQCHTGDVAADSYHQIERDVEMVRELGLDFYRISISWTRVLPTSFTDQINEDGFKYYSDLFDELLKYNIEPMVTLYHWDLPQKLQDMGGWTNPYIVDWFVDYARVIFERYGDRVKYWITFNEPSVICNLGYSEGTYAPLLTVPGIPEYMCAKHLLLAHAKTYKMFNEEFRQNGSILGITLNVFWYEPESANHFEAAEDIISFQWGIYLDPIFSRDGDFPLLMREKIAAKSAAQGFQRSRLPEFTPEEVELVRGSSDFLGLNHYSTYYAYRNESVYTMYEVPSMVDDVEVAYYQPSEWQGSQSYWLKVVPWGFYNLLTYIKDNYNNPPIYITENGYSTEEGLNDDNRANYYRLYLDAMLDAMEEGTDVRGYTAWSLMDNFEWLSGYTERFGLYEVDFESPLRTRTPRKSAFIYKQIVRSRELDPTYEPDTNVMTIDEGH